MVARSVHLPLESLVTNYRRVWSPSFVFLILSSGDESCLEVGDFDLVRSSRRLLRRSNRRMVGLRTFPAVDHILDVDYVDCHNAVVACSLGVDHIHEVQVDNHIVVDVVDVADDIDVGVVVDRVVNIDDRVFVAAAVDVVVVVVVVQDQEDERKVVTRLMGWEEVVDLHCRALNLCRIHILLNLILADHWGCKV